MAHVTPGGPEDDADYVEDDEWICLVDEHSGNYYYYNIAQKTTSWRKPQDYVEPQWIENEDVRTGKRYYYHMNTKETTWKPPRRFKPFVSEALKLKRDRLNAERKAQKDEEQRLMDLMTTKPVHSRVSSIDSSTTNTPRPTDSPMSSRTDYKHDDSVVVYRNGTSSRAAVSGKAQSSRRDDSSDEDYEEEQYSNGGEQEEKEEEEPSIRGALKKGMNRSNGKSVSFTGTVHDNENKKRPQRQPQLDDRGGFWKQSLDPASGRKYYFHTKTKENTWKKPNAYMSLKGMYVRRRGTKPGSSKPDGEQDGSKDKAAVIGDWRRVLDPHSGRHYYFHKVTKEVRWILPADAVVVRASDDSEMPAPVRNAKDSKNRRSSEITSSSYADSSKAMTTNASMPPPLVADVVDDMSALGLEPGAAPDKKEKKKKKKAKDAEQGDSQRKRLDKAVKRSATFDTESMGYQPGLSDGQRDARSKKRAEKLSDIGLVEEADEQDEEEEESDATPWGVPPGPPSNPPSISESSSKILAGKADFEDSSAVKAKKKKEKKVKKKPSKPKKKKATDSGTL